MKLKNLKKLQKTKLKRLEFLLKFYELNVLANNLTKVMAINYI